MKSTSKLFFSSLLSVTLSVYSIISQAAELYFPTADNWETISPEAVGWDADLLNNALMIAGERNSSGVVVLHNGRIMAEEYWGQPEGAAYQRSLTGHDSAGRAVEDVASAQKSVVAILVGMAQERGYLSIKDAVSDYLEPGWSKASSEQESAITIEHLLSMNSGLKTDFTYSSAPDSEWLYNTPVYHLTMAVLMAATGLERNEITVNWLSNPLDLDNTSWTPRPWAAADIAVGLSTTARELARFGLMIAAGGRWQDEVILGDQSYLQAMLSPSQSMNPSYGYLWWLNGQEFSLGAGWAAPKRNGMLIQSAPKDLIAMQGAADRKLYLVPSLNLIITRLGANGSQPGSSFNDAFWEALILAAPQH